MAKFYGSAFGRETQLLGKHMGNYVVAKTTDRPLQHPSVVIAVDDIRASVQQVKRVGSRSPGSRAR